MKRVETIASYIGFTLTGVAIILFWFIHWILGLGFTFFVAAVIVWYFRIKKRGDTYFKKIAQLINCKFERGGFGYGKVTGMYRDHTIEIKVNRGYDSFRGLSGFIVSEALLNSSLGVLGGMKNFTSVTIYYNAHIMASDKLDDRTLVDENKIVYLPSSDEATGLPKCGVTTLIKYINKIIMEVKQIERDSPISTDD